MGHAVWSGCRPPPPVTTAACRLRSAGRTSAQASPAQASSLTCDAMERVLAWGVRGGILLATTALFLLPTPARCCNTPRSRRVLALALPLLLLLFFLLPLLIAAVVWALAGAAWGFGVAGGIVARPACSVSKRVKGGQADGYDEGGSMEQTGLSQHTASLCRATYHLARQLVSRRPAAAAAPATVSAPCLAARGLAPSAQADASAWRLAAPVQIPVAAAAAAAGAAAAVAAAMVAAAAAQRLSPPPATQAWVAPSAGALRGPPLPPR